MMTDADDERIMASAFKMKIQKSFSSTFKGQSERIESWFLFFCIRERTFCSYSETGFHRLVAVLNVFVLATVCSLKEFIWLSFHLFIFDQGSIFINATQIE